MHFLIVKSERIYNNKWTFDFVFITLSTHTIVCVTIHSTRAFSDTTVINGIIVEFSIEQDAIIHIESHGKKKLIGSLIVCNACMHASEMFMHVLYKTYYLCFEQG